MIFENRFEVKIWIPYQVRNDEEKIFVCDPETSSG